MNLGFSFHSRFLSFIGGTLHEIGKPEMQQKINSSLRKESIEKIAERLQTTTHTLQVIMDGLSQPESFDFRTGKLNLSCSPCLRIYAITFDFHNGQVPAVNRFCHPVCERADGQLLSSTLTRIGIWGQTEAGLWLLARCWFAVHSARWCITVCTETCSPWVHCKLSSVWSAGR